MPRKMANVRSSSRSSNDSQASGNRTVRFGAFDIIEFRVGQVDDDIVTGTRVESIREKLKDSLGISKLGKSCASSSPHSLLSAFFPW